MLDFSTPLLTVVSFPKWTGGKFLVNCLGLSPDAVFQDRDLAYQQLTSGLSTQDKLNELLSRLACIEQQWDDLGLGGPSFFGFGQDCWLHSDLDLIDYWPFDPVVQDTIQHDKKFFFIGHNVLFMQRFVERWPNLSMIVLDNHENFCRQYRPQYFARRDYERRLLDRLWREATSNWSDLDLPQDIDSWKSLPADLVNHISQNCPELMLTWKRWQYECRAYQDYWQRHQKVIDRDIYRWNLDWYLDRDDLIANLRKLYHWLNLGGFDADSIACYHAAWLEKLKSMSSLVFDPNLVPSDRWRKNQYQPSI